MATGRIASRTDRAGLRALFDAEGWLLWDDVEIWLQLESCFGDGYENDPLVEVAKLPLRGRG